LLIWKKVYIERKIRCKKKLMLMILNYDGKKSETQEIRELIKRCYFYPHKDEIITSFLTLREKAYKSKNTFRSDDIFMVQYLLMKPTNNEVMI
jgi:hypothetical protein